MIRAGSGISMVRDTSEAAAAAAAQALRSLPTGVADMAFLFVTAPHAARLKEAVSIVRERALPRHLVGCMGAGVLSLQADVEGGAGLALLLVESDGEILFSPFTTAASEEELSEESGERIGRQLRAHRGRKGVVVLLPDASAFRPLSFLEGLERELPGVPVVGGASCDDGSLRLAYQMVGESVASGTAAGVMMHGGFRPTILVAHSCLPVGESMTVTRSEGNLLYELEGRRAFDAFVKFVDARLGGDLRKLSGNAEVAVSEEGLGSPGGSYYVRPIVGVDPENGIVALSEAVHEGQKLAFTVRDPSDAWKHMQTELASLRRRRDGRVPAFGLYFNCAGRTSGFYGMPSLDTSLLKAALGDFPLVGFYGSSEVAPLAGKNRANFYSGVLLLADGAEPS